MISHEKLESKQKAMREKKPPIYELRKAEGRARRRKFAKEFSKSLDARAAARAVGYTGADKTVGVRASNAKRHVETVEEILQRLNVDADDGFQLTEKYVIRELRQVIRIAKVRGELNAILKAVELLGKTLSMFRDRSDITIGLPNFEELSAQLNAARERAGLLLAPEESPALETSILEGPVGNQKDA